MRNHDYTEMTLWLKKLAVNYANITWLYSIGKSVEVFNCLCKSLPCYRVEICGSW